ncbi:hypothetical protein BGZ83_011998 [Gryganskiella cystojenkinii]|nr:hypothetical protein BGZ83_011998 [Gryganskiella cystojenkinii]
MGAGVASILCSLLQDCLASKPIDVKAFLYAPPPVCTPNLAEKWISSQIAFVNENDPVPRASFTNALDLKEMIRLGAFESQNPDYNGLTPIMKKERIIEAMKKAQDYLRAADDVPRLVLGGKVAYICEQEIVGKKFGPLGCKTEILVEYSDWSHFTAMQLEPTYMPQHFPDQYDSKLDRAVTLAEAQSEQ